MPGSNASLNGIAFNGKPKATFLLSLDETSACGVPLNEFMRPLRGASKEKQEADCQRRAVARPASSRSTGATMMTRAFNADPIDETNAMQRAISKVRRKGRARLREGETPAEPDRARYRM